jgi:cytochrome P450
LGQYVFAVVAHDTFCLLQENVFEELDTIFEKSDKDITLGEVNKMDYLKRVIKETMRLLPAVPFILRTLDQDVQIGRQR